MITWLLRRARRSPSALTESNPARTEAAEEAPDEVQAPPRESLESFLSFGPRLSSDVQVRLVRPTLQSALISLSLRTPIGWPAFFKVAHRVLQLVSQLLG